MASPQWKVYNRSGQYVASCKHPEDAAVLIAFYGDGATIRWGHTWTVWTEGAEDQPASESYDRVAITCYGRYETRQRAAYEKVHGRLAA